MEIDQILIAIKSLSDADKEKIKAALESDALVESKSEESNSESNEEATLELKSEEQNSANDTKEKNLSEQTQTEEVMAETAQAEVDENAEAEAKETKTEKEAESEEQTQPSSDVVEELAPPIINENGQELPMDFKEIIDGLNAKNLALEAEIKQLKAKLEGAFGLSSKPADFARTNPLFDDDLSDIPRIRKIY